MPHGYNDYFISHSPVPALAMSSCGFNAERSSPAAEAIRCPSPPSLLCQPFPVPGPAFWGLFGLPSQKMSRGERSHGHVCKSLPSWSSLRPRASLPGSARSTRVCRGPRGARTPCGTRHAVSPPSSESAAFPSGVEGRQQKAVPTPTPPNQCPSGLSSG